MFDIVERNQFEIHGVEAEEVTLKHQKEEKMSCYVRCLVPMEQEKVTVNDKEVTNVMQTKDYDPNEPGALEQAKAEVTKRFEEYWDEHKNELVKE